MAGEIVPIFPLPNVVYFPGTRLSLHIFEPRYRQMLEDALARGLRIGMILLREGWEKEAQGAPETYRIGSHGRVTDVERLPDGRYNLALEEARRFEIVEFVQEAPYRAARVLTLPEGPLPPAPQRQEHLQRLVRLYAALSQLVGEDPAPMFYPSQPQEFDQKINTLAMSLRVPPVLRQELLEAPGPAERASRLEELLLRLVQRLAAQKRFDRLKARRKTH